MAQSSPREIVHQHLSYALGIANRRRGEKIKSVRRVCRYIYGVGAELQKHVAEYVEVVHLRDRYADQYIGRFVVAAAFENKGMI